MRFAAFLGVALAAMATSLGGGHAIMAPAFLQDAPTAPVRRRSVSRPYGYARCEPRGAKSQPHTGAGGRGAHRRWKMKRASGRL